MSNIVAITSSTRPEAPTEGQVYYESDSFNLIVWNGNSWVTYSPKSSGVAIDEEVSLTYTSLVSLGNITKNVGDLFYIRAEHPQSTITVKPNVNVRNSYVYVLQNSTQAVPFRFRYSYDGMSDTYNDFNVDEANVDTANWQGLYNLKAKIETILPNMFSSIEIGGVNNTRATFTFANKYRDSAVYATNTTFTWMHSNRDLDAFYIFKGLRDNREHYAIFKQ